MSLGVPLRLSVVLWMCLVYHVMGEMRFVCPRPQLPNAGITVGPCGNGMDVPFEENYMEVSPGLFTIQLEETVFHKGAPLRIALMDWNNPSTACVLLDHIPHNDAAQPISTPQCQTNSYPLGQCHGSKSYLTVNIPDIDCQKCVLQMLNVATDLYPDEQKPCHQREAGSNNCTTYYSCANIRIRPTARGVGKNINSCIYSRLRLQKRWPYTPVKRFEIQLSEPFNSENYFNLYERPDWTLEYEYSLTNRNITVRRGSSGIFEGARSVRLFPGYKGRFRSLGLGQREKLHNGTYHIRVTGRFRNGTYQNFIFPIESSTDLYQDDDYRNHGVMYSPGGFLAEKSFAGSTATFAEVNYPAGQCQAPGKESFGAILTLHKSVLPRCLATFTITRNLMFGQFACSYEMDRVILVTKWNNTEGQPKSRNIAFNKDGITGFMDSGAEFIEDYLGFTSGRTPTDMTLTVLKAGKLSAIFGKVQKGIKAEVKGGLTMVALAFVTLHETQPTFNVHIMVSNATGLIFPGYQVSLDGPAISLVITNVKKGVELDGGAIFFNVTVPIQDMEVPQLLWSGLFSITVRDAVTALQYTGQLEKLTSSVCEGSNNIACKSKIMLTASGGSIDRGARTIPPNGMAMVAVANNQMLMDISISVQDLKKGDSIGSVNILRNGRNFITLKDFDFQPILEGQNRLFAKGQVILDTDILESLRSGLLALAVTVSRNGGPEVRMSGHIDGRSVISNGLVIPRRTVTDKPPPAFVPKQQQPFGATTQPTQQGTVFNPFATKGRNGAPLATQSSLVVCVSFLLLAIVV